MLSITKFAQNVSLTIINGLTDERIILPIIKGLFGLLIIMFLLLGVQTGINIYHTNIKQFVGGLIGLIISFIGLCLVLYIISEMTRDIKQERLDIKRNDSGEDYIEVSCEHYNSDDRNVYTIGGQNANDYQYTKLSEFVDYIKQNQLKIGKYIVDRQNNTFKKIDIEE